MGFTNNYNNTRIAVKDMVLTVWPFILLVQNGPLVIMLLVKNGPLVIQKCRREVLFISSLQSPENKEQVVVICGGELFNYI